MIVVFWPIWPIAVGINCCCYASVLTVLRRLSIFTNQKSEANALPLKVRNFSCTGTVVTWLLSEKRVRQFHACNNFLILIISWCSLVWLFVCFLYGNVGDLLPITVNGENKVVSDLIKLNLYSCFCVLFFANFQRWSKPRNEHFDYIRHTEQVRRLFGSFSSHLWHLVWMGITVHFNKGQKSRFMLSALFHWVISLLKIFCFYY